VSALDLAKMHKTSLDLTLRAERRLFKGLRLFAEYAYEQSLSDALFDQYDANLVSGGVSWEF
jgi:hypothetical protein